MSEQAPQDDNISTTSTTTVGASSTTTSMATTTPAPSSMTSSGTKPKAAKPSTTPKENFDSTYLKENQCICGYEAADGHVLRVHTKQGSQLASCRTVFCTGFHVVTSTTHGVHMDTTWHPCGNHVVSCGNHIVSTSETMCCPPGNHIVSTWKPNGVHLETT